MVEPRLRDRQSSLSMNERDFCCRMPSCVRTINLDYRLDIWMTVQAIGEDNSYRSNGNTLLLRGNRDRPDFDKWHIKMLRGSVLH